MRLAKVASTNFFQCQSVFFPSIYPEAFGIVGIEAMMRGKPVIAFDIGGVSTWLENNYTGFLVQNGNFNVMCEYAETLLQNPTLYRDMSINARKKALDYYTPKIHISKLVEMYNQALK